MEEDKVYWTTKDGQKISVDDMDINHLRNTLKMLIKSMRVKTVAPKPKRKTLKSFYRELMDSYRRNEDFDEPDGWGF
jgi:hypothetical protein